MLGIQDPFLSGIHPIFQGVNLLAVHFRGAFKPIESYTKLPAILDLPTDRAKLQTDPKRLHEFSRLQMRPRNLNSFCDFGPDNHGQEARILFWRGEGFKWLKKNIFFRKMGNLLGTCLFGGDDPKILLNQQQTSLWL